MMNQNKRKIVKGLSIAAVWSTPLVTALPLPVHAMTSLDQCSAYETEDVDQPISIVVSSLDVAGPVTAVRTGQDFALSLQQAGALCADSVTQSSSSIEFSGTIDSASNSISGIFNVQQYCGDRLVCEQLATFSATQTPADNTTDLGNYQGQVVGTLRCCLDLV